MARQTTHQTKSNPEKSPRREPTASGQRDAAVNRIASHNYFLLEKFEAGVALTGTEVKSIRGGLANLKDSYGLVKDNEVWLLNAHIGPYEHGNIFNHAPLRTRKLLMHREEIRKLIGKTQQKGLTLIPTRMYFKNGRVKVELALAKGKQLWDKRETERRRTADKEAREAAERAGIEIRYYNIIYDLVDDVKKAMSGLLAPTVRETMLGNATILEIFKVSKVGNVAGCRVTDGVVERGANVRLIRDSVVVHEGKLSQLKRFKDDAREVVAGQECGMAFESYQDMKVGDVIECYRVETVQRSL